MGVYKFQFEMNSYRVLKERSCLKRRMREFDVQAVIFLTADSA